MNTRHANSSQPTDLQTGDIEYEMGVALPGKILPKEAWAQTALKKLPVGFIDFEKLFARQAPLVLDIGCGNGRFTISSGLRRPDWDHIAIDILPAVIRYGTRRANQRGLSNVRFAACDGWKFLTTYSGPATLDEIHIYHPQPFADSTQTSGRMLTPSFLALMHACLKPNGKIFLQSDRKPYWDYITASVPSLFQWSELAEPWPEDPLGRSRREVISMQQGLQIFRGEGQRRDLSHEQVEALVTDLPQPNFQLEREQNTVSRFRSRRRSKRNK